jgi:hypothetical protein
LEYNLGFDEVALLCRWLGFQQTVCLLIIRVKNKIKKLKPIKKDETKLKAPISVNRKSRKEGEGEGLLELMGDRARRRTYRVTP